MSWFEFSLGRAARYRFAPAWLLTLCLPALAQAQSADLAITKTDGVTTATPGGSVTYYDHRLQRGPRCGERGDGGRYLPSPADLHLDLCGSRRGDVHRVRVRQHQQPRQPAGGRQRDLHGQLLDLGERDGLAY
jgi:hypothetical protein